MNNSRNPSNRVTSPKGEKENRKGMSSLLLVILIIGVFIAVGMFGWAELQRRNVEKKLEETRSELEEIKTSTRYLGEEGVAEILNSVRQLIVLPEEPEPVVATIIDVDALRAESDFYLPAENGDHLVITENRAILYSATRNVILDVVPIEFEEDIDLQPAEELEENLIIEEGEVVEEE